MYSKQNKTNLQEEKLIRRLLSTLSLQQAQPWILQGASLFWFWWGRKCPRVFFLSLSPAAVFSLWWCFCCHLSVTNVHHVGVEFIQLVHLGKITIEEQCWDLQNTLLKGKKLSLEWCGGSISSSWAPKRTWNDTNSILITTYLQNEAKGQ